jgi:hypothetical protein
MTLFFCCLSLYSRNKTCSRYCFNRWWSFEFYWRWVVAVDAWEAVELKQILSKKKRWNKQFDRILVDLKGCRWKFASSKLTLAWNNWNHNGTCFCLLVQQKPSKWSQSFMSLWVEVLNICTSNLPYFTAGHLIIFHRIPKFP